MKYSKAKKSESQSMENNVQQNGADKNRKIFKKNKE